jgi:hypothetical protein
MGGKCRSAGIRIQASMRKERVWRGRGWEAGREGTRKDGRRKWRENGSKKDKLGEGAKGWGIGMRE